MYCMIGRNIFVDRVFRFRKDMNQAHCKLCEFLHADSGTRIIRDLGEECKYAWSCFTKKSIFQNLYLKGVCLELFDFRFFHESVTPWTPSILMGPFQIFLKIRGDIANFAFFAAVNDTSDNPCSGFLSIP